MAGFNPYYTSTISPPQNPIQQMNASLYPQAQGMGYQQMGSQQPNFNTGGIKKMDVSKNPWMNNDVAGKIGGIANAASGLVEGIGGAVELGRQLNEPIDYYNDMKFSVGDTEVNGVPSYAGVAKTQKELGAIDPKLAGKGAGMTGFKGGASVGASIGGAIGGGVGAIGGITALPLGAIGAGVGAVAGGIGGWIAGMTKKGKAAKAAYEAQQRAQKELKRGQNEYNEDVEDYYDTVDTKRQTSQGEQNRASRRYGTAQYNDPFRSIL